MSQWLWLDAEVLTAVHEAQLAEHGGLAGVRDPGLFASAIARPEHLATYGTPDACELAACYAWGLARNHPFLDGKRTAFVALELFLDLNGHELLADDADCVLTILGFAAGDIEEAELAQWIREHSRERR